MVVPPLASILAAAAVALLSSGTVVVLRKRGITKQRNDSVLFTITPQQREAVLQSKFADLFTNETRDIRETFAKEGYVIMRGLLDDASMDRLDQASHVFLEEAASQTAQTFSALKFGPVYLSPPNNETSNTTDLSAFRDVAMLSAIPSLIGSVLLDLDSETDTLRVLKDVFLAKGREQAYCGWHVDDFGFWPTSAHATSDRPGVNAWIAMDDIPRQYGGGLAVAPRSHTSEWRHEAYEAIGSTQTFPEGGYTDVASMMSNANAGGTCIMATTSPKLNARIDKTKHVFDFRKGDVLIHTRWIFHRSVPLTKTGEKHFEGEDPVLRRYSIRYELGSAQLIGGFALEPSCVLEPNHGGESLDRICENDSPWYPKCWPKVDQEELAHLHEIVDEKLPASEVLRQDLFRELAPYFRRS